MRRHERLRGLAALVTDAVEHGSRGVEEVHKAIAARPFAIVAMIPALAAPAEAVHAVYDLSVGATYGMVRLGNRLVRAAVDGALDVVEARDESTDG